MESIIKFRGNMKEKTRILYLKSITRWYIIAMHINFIYMCLINPILAQTKN